MRILRNIENDRCFPFTHALAKEKWIEMLEIDGASMPEHLSEEDKKDILTKRISKDTLPKDSYEQMHWTQLKKEVERMGHKYTTPAEAVSFLRTISKKAKR